MLLDMSMQTYDISEDEMGGEPEPLAGTKILSQMYLVRNHSKSYSCDNVRKFRRN